MSDDIAKDFEPLGEAVNRVMENLSKKMADKKSEQPEQECSHD